MEVAQLAGVADSIHIVPAAQSLETLHTTDVVIAMAGSEGESSCASPLPLHHLILEAFAYGRPVLAADIPENRDISPEGAGCIWFKDGDDNDLVRRAAFLAAVYPRPRTTIR